MWPRASESSNASALTSPKRLSARLELQLSAVTAARRLAMCARSFADKSTHPGGLTIGSANWLIETDDRLPCPPGPTHRCSKAVLTAHSAGKSCTWVEQRGSPIDCLGCSDIQSHSRSTDSRGSMLCSSHLSIRARTCHLLRPHAGLDKSPVNGAYRVTSCFPTGFALQNVPTHR